MVEKNHIHTFERAYKNKEGTEYWICTDPECPPRRFRKELILGKETLCPDCSAKFILTRDLMLRKRPKCILCRNTKEALMMRKVGEKAGDILDDLFNESGGVNHEPRP